MTDKDCLVDSQVCRAHLLNYFIAQLATVRWFTFHKKQHGGPKNKLATSKVVIPGVFNNQAVNLAEAVRKAIIFKRS